MNTPMENVWGVILAGGDGSRLQEYTRSLYGCNRPKQFCVFTGTRSMLEHTTDRVGRLIPAERILTLLRRDHLQYAAGQLHDADAANLIVFPYQRETAPSVLYSLLRVRHRDRDAIVALFPSDHFIRDEDALLAKVRRGVWFVQGHPDEIVLLGVDAAYPETEYGWIEPGDPLVFDGGTAISRVRRFYEKPHHNLATKLMSRGCLWNTMITVARADTMLGLFRMNLPGLVTSFEDVARAIGTAAEADAVEEAFRYVPPINFSTGLLRKNPRMLAVLPVPDIGWSDWGTRDRILGTLGARHPAPGEGGVAAMSAIGGGRLGNGASGTLKSGEGRTTGRLYLETQQKLEREISTILETLHQPNPPQDSGNRLFRDFRAQERLYELRSALEDLRERTYGKCLVCGGEIEEYILGDNPTAHSCASCAVIGTLQPGHRS